MNPEKDLELMLVLQLKRRGLSRAPGALGFAHLGSVVRFSIKESVYRGLFIIVHDEPGAERQFRARDGEFDWDAIAHHVRSVVDVRRLRSDDRRDTAAAAGNALSMRASPARPGRVRVNVPEIELDAAAAMQLYVLLAQANPVRRGEAEHGDPGLL